MKIKNINLNGHRMTITIERLFPSGAIRIENLDGWEHLTFYFSTEAEAIRKFKENFRTTVQMEGGVR